MKLLQFIKSKYANFISDLKYDRHLSGVYKKANKRIKEAQGLAVERNGTVYVLPDPNVKGDFFCVVGRDIPELIRRRVFTKKMNGFSASRMPFSLHDRPEITKGETLKSQKNGCFKNNRKEVGRYTPETQPD